MKMTKTGGCGRVGASRVLLLCLRLCLSGWMLPAAADAAPDSAGALAFERYDVVLDDRGRQTVVAGFLADRDVADLAVVQTDAQGRSWLQLFAFDGGNWSPASEATLGADITFVDVANIDGRDQVVTYGQGLLRRFDPDTEASEDLASVVSDFEPLARHDVARVDVSHDLTGDGRDDLVVPSGHGFEVFVQLPGGGFAEPVHVGPGEGLGQVDVRDGYRHDPWAENGRVHELDYDRDGRGDLAFWDDHRFVVHLQDERGRYSREPVTFTTGVVFDSDEIATLAAPTGIRNRRLDHMPEGKSTGRVLHHLGDMNGDGVADIGIFWLKGGGLWKMHSSYEVYFGVPAAPSGTTIDGTVDAVVDVDGILAGLERRDVDGDGEVDLMFTVFDPTLLKAVRVLVLSMLNRTGAFDLEFYRMNGGRYPRRRDAVREIRPVIPSRSGETTSFPAVRVGDMNGDGLAELVIQRRTKRLDVYLGVSGPELFARRPQRVRVEVPLDEEYTWLVDVDGDGRQDVAMHHASKTERDRVTMLIAR